ncbi:peptide chain release factor PrfB2, chloroplastic [Amborella trichopoda]|uniref:peptide chain release factor PrfB2, chloroplastic n=1 Tax=Amborella trichopoda TaxID=13333 RepID=UPI0005D2E29F|nr:peptide chain release factor PrfB2, chloroplastic [Amborella trichopoda]|eukprot:XP_011627360.1 peptide chain release factor PrfB2, chloroplastic [Amborella trichopoda]
MGFLLLKKTNPKLLFVSQSLPLHFPSLKKDHPNSLFLCIFHSLSHSSSSLSSHPNSNNSSSNIKLKGWVPIYGFSHLRTPEINSVLLGAHRISGFSRGGKHEENGVHCSGLLWRHGYSSQLGIKEKTSDELSVDKIVARCWPILDETEGVWTSHAASIAQSIQLVKKRLQWTTLMLKLDHLSLELNKPDLWDDPICAGKLSREHGSIMSKIKEVNGFERELLEHIEMLKLAREEGDSELESESMKALLKMRRVAKEKELEALLSGEHDSCSCFIEVQAGAGGTESMDWAAMVMNMYKMWAQHRGFRVTVIDEMPGEIAGIKRATIKVDGEYAFGYAKAEVGVHRLVRISPFDSAKRRHTSFAAVAVIPMLGDSPSRFQINESDLRIERFRAGGAGGQHVNTTESAVRIVHIPTGVTATCQNERSQHQNKAMAMSVLQSRLDQLEMARQAQMNAKHTQSLTEISWGNQIRTYVLHPYRMVKDLRTNYEVSDPDSVLQGDIDGFILSFLSDSIDKDGENL